MATVRIYNAGDGPVVVNERYLYPGESLLVDSRQAAAILIQHPERLVSEGEEGKRQEEKAKVSDDNDALSAEDSPGDAFWEGEEPAAVRDNLRAIRGIGARVEEALRHLGIDSYVALAGWDAGVLAAALDGSSLAQVERWQAEALKLMTRLDG